MSQHLFCTLHDNTPTRILMGWDRPLQGYFMVIEKPDIDEDEPFWSNLTHCEPSHPKNLKPFLAVLKKLSITVPLKMIEEVLEDGVTNHGNKEVTHKVEGEIYERIMGIQW